MLDWFEARQGRAVDPALREVARAGMAVNAAREAARLEGRDASRMPAQGQVG